MDASWKSDLAGWIAPFLAALRHKVRARMCSAYVAGLIGAGYDQLYHFIASGIWERCAALEGLAD